MRQIILDVETTGLFTHDGNRIIEIACLEMINRRLTGKYLHTYLNPNRSIDDKVKSIVGYDDYFLLDKPQFEFIVDKFVGFIYDSELIIHNADFDIGFINYELNLMNYKILDITKYVKIFDTLKYARYIRPGKRNNLDALCKHYNVEDVNRKKHSAMVDTKILAKVYLNMTTVQKTFVFEKFDRNKNFDNKDHNYDNKIYNIDSSNKNVRLFEDKYLNFIKNSF